MIESRWLPRPALAAVRASPENCRPPRDEPGVEIDVAEEAVTPEPFDPVIRLPYVDVGRLFVTLVRRGKQHVGSMRAEVFDGAIRRRRIHVLEHLDAHDEIVIAVE